MYSELKDLLKQSETCLFLTGAGMSADSNIPTFRDREGYWRNFPIFKEKGLMPQDLASPDSFRKQPRHSWAFYEWRRRNARENSPHSGYEIINKMINSFFHNSFVHSTNTDGYHIISGLDKSKVLEVHGSMWRLQCMRGGSCGYGVAENCDVPLCGLDYDSMSANNMPLCPECGSLLRPNIQMFGDFEYIENEYQYACYEDFLSGCPRIDMAFLIGSSSQIPTNDYIAKRLQQNGTKIVTINPDISSTAVCRPDIFLQEKSLDALLAIEQILDSI